MTARPLRLFVAVYPPLVVAVGLSDAARSLAEATPDFPPHRLIPTDQVHLTLQFIGDTAPRDVDDVVESVRRSASRLAPTTLTPQRLILLPQPRRARLVAAETDAPPTIAKLKRRLASRLARRPRRRAGDRFLPHLTLVRFRSESRIVAPDGELAVGAFDVAEIRLMRSVLRSDGAQHQVVETVALG